MMKLPNDYHAPLVDLELQACKYMYSYISVILLITYVVYLAGFVDEQNTGRPHLAMLLPMRLFVQSPIPIFHSHPISHSLLF